MTGKNQKTQFVVLKYSGTWQQARFRFWTHFSPMKSVLFLTWSPALGSRPKALGTAPPSVLWLSASGFRSTAPICWKQMSSDYKCNYCRARRNSPEVESGCMATSRICSSNVTSVSLARSWGPLSDHTDTQNKRRVAPSEQNQGWPPQRKSYLQKTTATRETLIGMSYLTKLFTFCLSYQCKKWIMTPSQPLLTKTVVNNMIKVFNLPSQFNACLY